MLFMNVMSWDPDKRDRIIERWLENGPMVPEGARLIGDWIGGCRVFRLIEADDIKSISFGRHAWTDLAKIETIPVMESEEAMAFLQGQ